MTRNKTKKHINVRDLKPRKDAKSGVGRNFRVRDLKPSKDSKGGTGGQGRGGSPVPKTGSGRGG